MTLTWNKDLALRTSANIEEDANIKKQESEAEGKIIFTSEDTSGGSSIVGKA
jgi:hypothetical protein